jgi:chromate transporter
LKAHTQNYSHSRYERGGLLGLFNAGFFFISPAMFITLIFAVIYTRYGSIPDISIFLAGVKAAIMAVIINALYRLFTKIIKTRASFVYAAIVGLIYYLGISEIPLLFFAGLSMMLYKNKDKIIKKTYSLSLPIIFLTFLKIGSVLYGSGYVLLAFLEAEFVETLGVLTQQQILDAVAVGQFTPGPVFTTATFIGYLLGGFPGAILATLGIFLPAFTIVAILKPIIPRARKSKWLSGALDGVNIASVVLMLFVSIKLGIGSVTNIPLAIIFVLSIIGLMRFKINTVWLILGGGLINYVISIL